MPKILSLSLEDEDLLCELAASLSSPARIQTLKLLYFNSYSVGEIAEKLNIPYSSASLYVKSLENVGLIKTKTLQGSRGAKKYAAGTTMPSAYGSIKRMTASIRFQRFPCRSAATQNAKLCPAAALFPKPDIWRPMIDPKCFSCRITSLRSSSGQRPALSNINFLICLRRRISQRGFSSPSKSVPNFIITTKTGQATSPFGSTEQSAEHGAARAIMAPGAGG